VKSGQDLSNSNLSESAARGGEYCKQEDRYLPLRRAAAIRFENGAKQKKRKNMRGREITGGLNDLKIKRN